MKKLSVIRGNTAPSIWSDENSLKCPYGLDITTACKDVGDTILKMQDIDSIDKKDIYDTIKKNKIIYYTQKIGERCPFANEILEKFNKVDCSWGDTAAGEGVSYLTPSPLYPRTFIGDGLEPGSPNKGQDIYDPRQYFDAPERGIDVPYGLFSIFSSRSNEMGIIRVAEKYTNKSPNIKGKLALLRDKYFDTLKSIIPSGFSPVKLDDEQLEKLLFVVDDWTK